MGSPLPSSARSGQAPVSLSLEATLVRRGERRASLSTRLALLGVAMMLAAPAGMSLAAEGTAGDAGDEVRASRRLREHAASLRPATAAAGAPAAPSAITRDVGQIAVIEHDGTPYDRDEPDGTPNYTVRAALAQRFYQTHGDNYDFIVVFTNFEFATGSAIAFHSLVRNEVQGIGKPVLDNGPFFGSPGRLRGFVDMAAIDRYRGQPLSARAGVPLSMEPNQPGWRDTLNVLAHEVGHQWLAQPRYRDATGASSAALLSRDGVHWSYLLDSDASVMYGSDWRLQPGGDWRADRVFETYSPLDLYLMGMTPPAHVPPFTLLRNPAVDATLPREGDVVSATPETVSLGQIVAAEGARQPPSTLSPKTFRAAFVLLTAPGVEPDPDDLAAVDRVRAAFVAHFFALTGGVGLVDTTLAELPPEETAAAPDLDLALAWLLSQQSGDGFFEDVQGSAVRDTGTVIETLREIGLAADPYGRALSWLSGTGTTNTDFLLRRALALAPVLSSADKQALVRAIKEGQNRDGGFGLGPGYQSDPLDTALALRAWAALGAGGGGTTGAAIDRALVHLRAARHLSGLWPMVPLGEPSTVVSAHVLLALQDHAANPIAQGLLGPTLDALLARRNPDGGFGESPSTPYATALVLQALLRGTSPEPVVEGAVSFLRRTQAPNGSWTNSGYTTSLVLRALKGGLTPNLTVPPGFLTVQPAAPHEGDVVHVEARVRNVGRRPAPATLVRLYDTDPADPSRLIGEQAIGGLDPGQEAPVAFDWPTLDRAGSHVLYVVVDPDGTVPEAREDDNAASRPVAVTGKLPDLVIGVGDLAVTPYPPEEGEIADVQVTVHNTGQQKSGATLVRVFRGDPRLGGAIIGEAALASLLAGHDTMVVIPWPTQGQAGSAELFALADPDHRVDESDETNNETSLPVRVSAKIPPGPDLEIARVSVDPPVLSTIPQTVVVHVLVRNVSCGRTSPGGSCRPPSRDEATDSSVELRDQDTDAVYGELDVSIPWRSAVLLSFPVTVAQSGNRSFLAIADPAGVLPEADEDNNVGLGVLVDPGDTFDVEIRAGEVTPSATTLTLGDVLTVTALVHNKGTAPILQLPVVLRHAAGTAPAELARAFVGIPPDGAIPPGGATTVSLEWTTAFTGDPVPLAVVADPFDLLHETSETNNRVDLQVTIHASDRPNLTASGADVAFDPDPPVEGQPANVSLVVRNPTPVAAGPFVVRFFRGDPDEDGVAIGEARVAGVDPLGQATATVTWDPVDVRGVQGLFVLVDADGEVDEYDETDNRAFRPFAAVGLPDLVVTAGNVLLDPAFPRAGQPVTVTAKVLNLGAQTAPATLARVIEGEGPGAVVVAEQTVGPLAPGAAQVLSLVWTPSAPAGERSLIVLADAGETVREQDEGNNRARRVVVVQDANLYLTHPFFSPDGDGVQDETSFAWRTEGVTSVQVAVSNSRGQLVRTLATGGPTEGSVTWDGRDEHGRLLWDGTYTFTLRSDRGTLLGRRQAVLDTNHSSIHDAAGTGLVAVRNMTCALPDLWNGPAWLPAEDEALFILNYPEPETDFTPGLLRVGLDGQFVYVGAPDPWYANAYFPYRSNGGSGPPVPTVVSPDGREALVFWNGTLFAVDLATGGRRELASGEWGHATWSPDGRMILVGTRVITRDGTDVGQLPDARSGWVWSPDGQFLAGDLRVVRPDGSSVREFDDSEIGPVSTIEWRGDGKIFVSDQFGGEEDVAPDAGHGRAPPSSATAAHRGPSPTPRQSPGQGGGAFVLDPETGEVRRLEWVDTLPDQPQAFDWSPDGSKVLYHVINYIWQTPSTRVSREDGQGTRQLGAFHAVPGPRKSVASWLNFDEHFVCAGGQDVFVLQNLLNLAADLQISRLPANDGLQIRGTASDLNLDHHQLEWATEAAPDVWHPLGAASETAVISDAFTVWVPAVPGRYLVRLRVVDRAGNERARTKVITWDRTPAIVNVTQSERLISPNGDGRRDAVRFDYLVQEPARLEVRVVGPAGAAAALPVVRRFSFEYPDIGPAGFEWDGRDGGGRVVPDGRYTVYLNELPFPVEVDATPPDLDWSESEPTLVGVQAGNRTQVRVEVGRAWHVVDPNLTGWTSPEDEGTEQIYDPERDSNGDILFDARGAPRIHYVEGRVADRRDQIVLGLADFISSTQFGVNGFPLTGSTIDNAPYARLAFTADDRAANTSVLPVPPRAERLLLMMAEQENAQVVLAGPRSPGTIHRLAPVKSQFHLLSTTAEHDAPVFFRYQDRAGGPPREAPVPPKWLADPAVLGLQPGHEYQAEFVQRLADGRELHTDTFLFKLCDAAAALTVKQMPEPVPQAATDTWQAALEAAIGEPIAEARLEIMGTGDNAGFHQTVRLSETERGSGKFLYEATTPAIEDCDAPEIGEERAGLHFQAVIVGESGRSYRGPSDCLRLAVDIPNCGTELFLSQGFEGCEGTPDELHLTVAARGPSSARVAIERGAPDAPVPVAELTMGEHTIVLDATGVPQGGLPVRARLFEPGTGTTVMRRSLQMVVDRTPPEADVIEPPEGGAVCVTRDPELGAELARLTFVADDAYDPISIGPGRFHAEEDVSWSPLALACAPGDRFCPNEVAGGAVLQRAWRVDGLASGRYEIEQTFCDRSGNRAAASRRFTLSKVAPTITLESVARAIFSPNGDGRADQTAANILLSQTMVLSAEVHAGTPGGPLVEVLFRDRTHLVGSHAIPWTGRPGGAPAPDGVYVIVVRGSDACGGTAQVGARVQVDDTPPAAEIDTPAPGSRISSAVDLVGRTYDSHFTSYELSFGEGASPSSWTRFSGAPYPVGSPPGGAGLLGPWLPPPVPGPGPLTFTLRLVATDEAENEGEARVTVDVGPRALLDYIAVRPTLFSPNGDERRETVTIEYRLLAPARVTLQVRTPGDAVLRSLETGLDHGAETVAMVWDGLTDAGTPAPEGDLLAWVRAEDPGSGSSQQQAALFTLDRTPPALVLQLPAADAYVPRDTLVVGRADDARLAEWRVSAATPAGAPTELGRGTEAVPTPAPLASLDLLSDGPYTLVLQAEDAAENRSNQTAHITVDSIPPHAVIELAAQAVLRKGPPPIAIRGSASDLNFQEYVLSYGSGPAPAYFVEIRRSATGGDGIVLGEWAVASLVDGDYTLRLVATDKAGHTAEAEVTVSLDGTPPEAALAEPGEGTFVTSPVSVVGTASDAHLETWHLEMAPGDAAAAFQWSPVLEGTDSVGPQLELGLWAPLPPDGHVTLRLTARDRVGFEAQALRTVIVDTTPPAAPTGLAHELVHKTETTADVRLTWNPNSEPDLAGYFVYRDDERIAGPITPTTFTDAGRPDGTYLYAVSAVDRAGNESPLATHRVRVDLTPPVVDLLRPAALTRVSGTVDVIGTAFSLDDFKEYRLSVGAGANPTSFILLRRSTVPVAGALLGPWTAVGSGPFVIALEAEDTSGNSARATVSVIVDNDAPGAPVLTSVVNTPAPDNTPVPDALTSTWTPSTATDLAGYVVYRNGRVANAPGVVIGDLRPFLVPGPSYDDRALPDGDHCYRVAAMDAASNLSAPSNEICRTLDNRPPHALLVEPPAGTRFDFPLHLLAFTPDTDIAEVRFEYRAQGTASWTLLGAPDTQLPYESLLDPAPLAFGPYELRAVATDLGGRVDPAPEIVPVVYGDATPPLPPTGVATRVDGMVVHVSWNQSSETDLAGYRVARDGEVLTPDPITETTFDDEDVALGLHRYTVTAVDKETPRNESAPGAADAVVYKVTLDAPYPITSAHAADLNGSGAEADTIVHVERDGTSIAQVAPPAAGAFAVPGVPLEPAGNVLLARGIDAAGNRSVPSDEIVLISNEPPLPVTGTAAVVTDHQVKLQWDAVVDPELAGYIVRRKDVRLTPSVPQTDASAVEASDAYPGFDAANAFDGNPDTAWLPLAESSTWTVTFPAPVLVEKVALQFRDFGSPVAAARYRIEVGWEGRLLPLVSVTGNEQAAVSHVLRAPFLTDRVRVALEAGPFVGLGEVAITRLDPATDSAFTDAAAPDGTWTYSVTAIDRYGAEGEAGTATAAVGDTQPPGKPTGLVAVVETSDVVLTWDPNPEPDIHHYVVMRDGVVIATTAETTYRDAGRPNGTYVYRIVAVDLEGSQSEPSDPATAVVLVTTPPAAPVILVPTDAAHPITIDATSTPVWGRARERDTVLLSVDGVLAAATTAGAALAFQGNWYWSDGSLLAPGGREVAQPGFGPNGYAVQMTPIYGGAPRLVADSPGYPVVQAFSRDGRSLAYQSDGQLRVLDLETTAQTPIDASPGFGDSPSFSPDGTRVAFTSSRYFPQLYSLRVYDRTSGTQRTLVSSSLPLGPVAWSSAGERIAAFALNSSFRYELRVYDAGTGAVQLLDGNAWPYAPPSWSADGTRVAYTRIGLTAQVRYFDFTAQAATDVTDGLQPAFDARFDPSGRWLSYHRLESDGAASSRTALVARDLYAGTDRTITTTPDPSVQSTRLHQWDALGYLHHATWSDATASVFAGFDGSFAFQSVRLAPGENQLVARALDPLTTLASADSETVRVTVSEASFPDLRVATGDLQASPLVPLAGQPTLLRGLVRNEGSLDAGPFRAVLRVTDTDGQTVFENVAETWGLEAGGVLVVSGYWTPAAAGAYVLELVADDTDVVVEAHEDDNAARRPLRVGSTATLGLEVSTDRTAYDAFASALVSVRATNGGTPFQGQLRLSIETAQGDEVALVDEREASLGYGEAVEYGATWRVAATYAGDYRVVVRALADGVVEPSAEASAAFRILPDVSVSARLRPDRVRVPLGQPAGLEVHVENRGVNQPLSGAVAHVSVRGGGPVVFAQDLAVPALLPGASMDAAAAWPAAAPAGAYTAELTVLDAAGHALAQAEAPFTVETAVVLLSGQLALQPAGVLVGDGTRAQGSVSNVGTVALSALPVRVEVVDGPTAAVLAVAELAMDLAPGQSTPFDVPVDVAGLAARPYPVFLRAGGQALARATLRVHAPITPPSIDSPAHGSRVATSHPTLVVNNASTSEPVPLRYTFELYADAALNVPLPGASGIAETPARTGWTVPTNLGEDQTYYWRARATDGFSSSPWSAVASFTVDAANRPPFAPLPDQPAAGARVASREVTLVVRNATDPDGDTLTYDLRLATDAGMTAIVTSVAGIAETPAFTSWAVPLVLDEDATYWWSARAFDGFAYSPWSEPVSFTVDSVNASPSAPTPLRPAAGADVTTLSPELVVANATDLEGDPLAYHFEIDVSASFDSAERQVSPAVPSGATETAWTPPLPLRDNTAYFWRAAADDGHSTGPFASSRFFVDLVNEPPSVPVPLAPAAGAVVATPTPTLRARNATDPEHDVLTYEFEVRDAGSVVVATAAGVPEGPAETTWPVAPALGEDQSYSWRVRASDGPLASGWSAQVPFRVNAQPDPPTAPTLIAPPEGAEVGVRRPALVVANATSPDGSALTYEFELYRQAADGTLTLVEAAAGVLPGPDRTSFTPTADLPDGAYSWRARARDARQAGPWMASAHFTVLVDLPPAPPTGLRAVPGDARVTLSWNASPEPDVTSYRVYRGSVTGGPYVLQGTTTTPSFLDTAVVNGTTYYYVVTARDARQESAFSAEVAATPRAAGGVIQAEVSYSPDTVEAGCLLCRCVSGGDHGHGNSREGHDEGDVCDDDDHHQRDHAPRDGHDEGHGDDDHGCPFWIYATIELPGGLSPSGIDRSSLRLAGDVPADAHFASIVDHDHDHLLELSVRFRLSLLSPHLLSGANVLRLTGLVDGRPFEGSATLRVSALAVSAFITPRTLKLKSQGQWVQAQLEFESDCGRADDVDVSSLRLNGVVRAGHTETAGSGTLIVKFDRRAVEATVSPGEHVEMRVTGRARGLPFTAVDYIRVIR